MERNFKDMTPAERKASNAKVMQAAEAHRKANEKLAKAAEKKTAEAEKYAKEQDEQRKLSASSRASGLDKIIASLKGTDFEMTDEESEALKTG